LAFPSARKVPTTSSFSMASSSSVFLIGDTT
jgi:hypothetical protein